MNSSRPSTAARVSSRPATAQPRRPLALERLEERTLLSVSPRVSFTDTFPCDPGRPVSYDASSIMVRFHETLAGPPTRSGAHFLAGTAIGPEVGLVSGLRTVRLGLGVRVTDALAAYRAHPLVAYAEPNYVLRTSAIPNDPNFGQLWGLLNPEPVVGRPRAHINAPPAWDVWTGTLGTVAAVIDTGVDANHPDLAENIWINEAEIPQYRRPYLFDLDGDGAITFLDLSSPWNQGPYQITDVNSDGRISAADILAPMVMDQWGNDLGLGGWANGVSEHGDPAHPDDLIGWDFANNTNRPYDTDGHGSHVAGIIGAVGNNGVGVVGVNWHVRLMPLKIGNGAELNLAAAVGAIAYAVANGAVVSNHSYTTPTASQALFDAMAAARTADHIIVAAAGNDGSDNDLNAVYPATFNLDNIMAVAATDNRDQRAGFSNYGLTTVHLGAPGVNIYSTSANGGYGMRSGTSMAAAYVTGAVAYLKPIALGYTYRQLIDLILTTSEPIASMAGRTTSGGRLSLARTLGIDDGTIIEEGRTSGAGQDHRAEGVSVSVGLELSEQPLAATESLVPTLTANAAGDAALAAAEFVAATAEELPGGLFEPQTVLVEQAPLFSLVWDEMA